MAFAPPLALDYLRRAHAAGRLGHAYLLIGDEQAGFDLAAGIAALVVRTEAGGVLTHQDVYVVEPESKARRILIEQVRELESALRLRASAVGGRKVGIIRQADRINTQAANAFLKTLEEPPADSLLLLVSSLPESLPETILSRCIKVVLQTVAAGADGVADSPEETALRELLAGSPASTPMVRCAAGRVRAFARVQRPARRRAHAIAGRGRRGAGSRGNPLRPDHRRRVAGRARGLPQIPVEARYVAARSRLVEGLARWWGDVLRCQTTDGQSMPSELAALARRLPTPEVLRRLAVLEELRENMDRNIQESLALEVAFLRVFGA